MTSPLWSASCISILQLTPRLMQLDLAKVQTQTPQVKRWSRRSLRWTTFSSMRVRPSSESLQCAAGFLFQLSQAPPSPAAVQQEEGVRVTGNQKAPGLSCAHPTRKRAHLPHRYVGPHVFPSGPIGHYAKNTNEDKVPPKDKEQDSRACEMNYDVGSYSSEGKSTTVPRGSLSPMDRASQNHVGCSIILGMIRI